MCQLELEIPSVRGIILKIAGLKESHLKLEIQTVTFHEQVTKRERRLVRFSS